MSDFNPEAYRPSDPAAGQTPSAAAPQPQPVQPQFQPQPAQPPQPDMGRVQPPLCGAGYPPYPPRQPQPAQPQFQPQPMQPMQPMQGPYGAVPVWRGAQQQQPPYGAPPRPGAVPPGRPGPMPRSHQTLWACLITGTLTCLVTLVLTLFFCNLNRGVQNFTAFWPQDGAFQQDGDSTRDLLRNLNGADSEAALQDWLRRLNGQNSSSDQQTLHFTTDADDPSAQRAADKLNEEIELLRSEYYEELSDADILNALAEGLPGRIGSKHTYYLPPEEYEQWQQSGAGEYAGIGATVQLDAYDRIVISDLTVDGPAEKAGLKVGDVFVSVDGEPVADGTPINSLAIRVRGKEGSTVDVEVYRPSDQRQYRVTVTRAIIHQKVIETRMLSDDLGYLSIDSFTDDSASLFKTAMQELMDAGAKKIVFDLRNNPGGSAQAVRDMLDYLLPKTDLVRIEGRSNGEPYTEVWKSDEQMGVPESMRYAILLNGHSASASELFSGCLRDLGKAVLVGEHTYGKGTGTITMPLNDGSAINITVFKYYLPNGDNLEDVGIEPDVPVKLDEAVSGQPLSRIDPADDNQLQTAIEQLK